MEQPGGNPNLSDEEDAVDTGELVRTPEGVQCPTCVDLRRKTIHVVDVDCWNFQCLRCCLQDLPNTCPTHKDQFEALSTEDPEAALAMTNPPRDEFAGPARGTPRTWFERSR